MWFFFTSVLHIKWTWRRLEGNMLNFKNAKTAPSNGEIMQKNCGAVGMMKKSWLRGWVFDKRLILRETEGTLQKCFELHKLFWKDSSANIIVCQMDWELEWIL